MNTSIAEHQSNTSHDRSTRSRASGAVQRPRPVSGLARSASDSASSYLLAHARVGDLAAQLERDLRALAADILGAPETEGLPDDCAAWVASTTAATSRSITRSTFPLLVRALDDALADAPNRIVTRLDDSRSRLDVGAQ